MTGETMLIYTTEEGGYFKTVLDAQGQIWRCSESEYEDIKRTGSLNTTPYTDVGARWIRPAFIALARIEDNYDFILKLSREDAAVAA